MYTRLFFILVTLLCLPALVMAAENEDIDYLLSFVAGSDCVFVRNGSEHSAREAAKHLRMKYNHVRQRIKTAPDFIDKIASRSSLSKKPYTVRCGDKILPSKQWLEEALAAHRRSAGGQ